MRWVYVSVTRDPEAEPILSTVGVLMGYAIHPPLEEGIHRISPAAFKPIAGNLIESKFLSRWKRTSARERKVTTPSWGKQGP